MANVASELQSNGAGTAVLQLKLSLRGVSKPSVWRRLLVPAEMRLSQLHRVIQTAMGWTDTHLHAFSTPDGDYGPPDPELDHRDERTARLSDFLTQPGSRIRYTYDFGDFWEHDIVLEKALAPDLGTWLPVCLAGKGACPPERRRLGIRRPARHAFRSGQRRARRDARMARTQQRRRVRPSRVRRRGDQRGLRHATLTHERTNPPIASLPAAGPPAAGRSLGQCRWGSHDGVELECADLERDWPISCGEPLRESACSRNR